MTKTILLALALSFATAAHAQQRTLYDAFGRVVGRAATDSQGSTTLYDSSGRVVARDTKSGNTTTIYDATGRNMGKTTSGPLR
jgi:YD repeat-containing protein